MPTIPALISQMRMLLNVQTPDDTWFSQVEPLSPLPLGCLTEHYWNNELDVNQFGSVYLDEIDELPYIVWKRPDGGTPIALKQAAKDDKTELCRFILYSRIIHYLNKAGQLSFVKVGFPPNWQKSVVYFNDKEVVGAVEADALIGTVSTYVKEGGQWKINEDKTLATKVQHGNVRIELREKKQGFF